MIFCAPRTLQLFCAIFTIINLSVVLSHVTLTFPEARFPPLDFLDTFRTAAPCGVPKSSRSALTQLRAGASYNITWRMQYPHQGGVRLQLLNAAGALVQQLAPTPTTSGDAAFDALDDQTVESLRIQFLRECHNCTLRLERQALEWGGAYRFQSCAEVTILPTLSVDCSGRGERPHNDPSESCACHKNFSGDHCQYEDDCSVDADCANGGKCVPNGISPNRKSCFCAYGYYGADCKHQSYSIVDGSASLGSDGEPCFAYANDFAAEESSLKYGMFNENCYKIFPLNNANDDRIYTRVVKNEVEVVLDFETDSWLALGWRPLQIPTSCRLFPDLAAGAHVSVDVNGRNNSEAIRSSGYLPSAFNAALHPMDCVDVVMASVYVNEANASFLHIEDMYTRDRSTPLNDAYFDGEQSLTAAYGRQLKQQSDGDAQNKTRSVVMFRRMIREIEPTDHPLGPGEIFIIYAKGQTAGAYSHLAKSALEKDDGARVRTREFYRADQWKYHGGRNRGARKLELITTEETSDVLSPLRHPQPQAKPKDEEEEEISREDAHKTVADFNEDTLASSTVNNSKSKLELTVEKETVSTRLFTTDSNMNTAPKSEPRPEPEPKPESEPETKAEPEKKNESEAEVGAQPEPKAKLDEQHEENAAKEETEAQETSSEVTNEQNEETTIISRQNESRSNEIPTPDRKRNSSATKRYLSDTTAYILVIVCLILF